MKMTIGLEGDRPEQITIEWYGRGANEKTTKLELQVTEVDGVAALHIHANDERLAVISAEGDIQKTVRVPDAVIHRAWKAANDTWRELEPYRRV